MSSSEYATLEEAFGIASFLAPEPQILRGDVGKVNDSRQQRFTQEINDTYASSGVGTPGRPAEPMRMPLETKRCQAGIKCGLEDPGRDPFEGTLHPCKDTIASAHARGGAEAAWKLIPVAARKDMMRYAVRQFFDSEFVMMAIVAACLYILFK